MFHKSVAKEVNAEVIDWCLTARQVRADFEPIFFQAPCLIPPPGREGMLTRLLVIRTQQAMRHALGEK